MEDGGDELQRVHAEEERIDPALDLDADRIDQHQRVEPVRRHRGQLGGDPAAERRAEHVDAVETERVEQVEVVEREVGDVLDPLGRGRAAVARMARRQQVEALGQPRLERQPAPAGAGPVQIEQGSAAAVAEEIDGRIADDQAGDVGHAGESTPAARGGADATRPPGPGWRGTRRRP